MNKTVILSTVVALGITFSRDVNADIPWNIVESGGLTLGGNALHPTFASLYIVLSTVPNGGAAAADLTILPGGTTFTVPNAETIRATLSVTALGPTGGPPSGGTFMVDNTAGDDLAVTAGAVDLIARVFAADVAENVIPGTKYLERRFNDPADTDAGGIVESCGLKEVECILSKATKTHPVGAGTERIHTKCIVRST